MKELLQWFKDLPLPNWIKLTVTSTGAIIALALLATQSPYAVITFLGLATWSILFVWVIRLFFSKRQRLIELPAGSKKLNQFEYPHRRKSIIGGVALLVVVIIAILIPQSRTFVTIGLGIQPAPIPLAFEPAKPEQIMLIIAKFQDLSEGKATGYDPEGYIYRAVTNKIGESNSRFPVRRYSQTVIANSEQAQQLLKDYNAAVVVWGTYNAAGGQLRISVVNNDALPLSLQPELKSDFQYSLARLESVEITFARDVPSQSVYVSLVIIGYTQYRAKQYDIAMELFNDAISTNSQKSSAYFYRGNIYFDQRKYDLAITDYSKAIELNPNDALAHNNRGLTYYNQKKYDLAIADFSKAVELDPQNALVFNNRGVVYAYQKNYDLAIADFNKAIEIDPKDTLAYSNRRNVNLDRGNTDLVFTDFTKMIEINPKNAKTYNDRGLVYYRQGEYDLALADYAKAIELDPKLANAYCGLGMIYSSKKDFAKAIPSLEQGVKIDPSLALCKDILDKARLGTPAP